MLSLKSVTFQVVDSLFWVVQTTAEEYEYIEIPKGKYDELNKAIKEMRMSYYNAAEFIEDRIDKVLQQ